MNTKLIIQSVISIVVVIILLITTSHNSMMSMNAMIAHTLPYASIALICTLIAMFLFEHRGDERDESHKRIADRYALFIVMLVLGIGVFVDQLHETFNPWMVGALSAAILAKMINRVVLYFKN